MHITYKCLISVIYLILVLGKAYATPAKIWIDTDNAIGRFGHDVDDGIALIMALRSPEVEIMGISLVTNRSYGYKITCQILGWYSNSPVNIPVFKGAHSAKDLGINNPAVEALAQALSKDKMTIIALGPITNIASFLLLYPELRHQIIGIVWCAGRSPQSHFNPGSGRINVRDGNFERATAAGQVLLNSGVKIVLAGYEPASSIYISLDDISPLEASSLKQDQWLHSQLKSWLKIWTTLLDSKEGFIPFDAITLGCFLYPQLASTDKGVPVLVETKRNDSPLFLFRRSKQYLVVSPDFVSSLKVDYCWKMDLEFKKPMLELLLNSRTERPIIASLPVVTRNFDTSFD